MPVTDKQCWIRDKKQDQWEEREEIGKKKIQNQRRDRCFTASRAPPPTQTRMRDGGKRGGREERQLVKRECVLSESCLD